MLLGLGGPESGDIVYSQQKDITMTIPILCLPHMVFAIPVLLNFLLLPVQRIKQGSTERYIRETDASANGGVVNGRSAYAKEGMRRRAGLSDFRADTIYKL